MLIFGQTFSLIYAYKMMPWKATQRRIENLKKVFKYELRSCYDFETQFIDTINEVLKKKLLFNQTCQNFEKILM